MKKIDGELLQFYCLWVLLAPFLFMADDDLDINTLKTIWFTVLIISFVIWLLVRVLVPCWQKAKEKAKLARAIIVHYNGK